MTKALAAVSAAIDLAQGIGNPVTHIAAIRDLAKDCEQLVKDLDDKTKDNSQLRMQMMSLHFGIMELQKELTSMYAREARRFPVTAAFDLSREGPADDISLMAMRSYRYTVRFKTISFISTCEMEDDIKRHPKIAEHLAWSVAQHFEKQLGDELKSIKRY